TKSFDTLTWMHSKGVKWELTGDKQVDPRTHDENTPIILPPGGAIRAYREGVGLMEDLFAAVEAESIDVWYDAPVIDLLMEGSTIQGVKVRRGTSFINIFGTVILAAGGFEANPEMR